MTACSRADPTALCHLLFYHSIPIISSPSQASLASQIPASLFIPRRINSISKSSYPNKWTSASHYKIQSLISQNVFDFSTINIDSIPSNLIIPSQVIFDIRMNADGTINKYNARLVAQGNRQDQSTFFDTFPS